MFLAPFNMLISGGSSSGKTTLLRKLLHERLRLIDHPPEVIFWCYGAFTKELLTLQKDPAIKLISGAPNLDDIQNESRSSMLILDDLMTELDKKTLADIYSKVGHHSNCSVILLSQNAFYGSLRNVRLNCHYYILLRNLADGAQVRTMSQQIFGRDAKVMQEAYADATKQPYSYLLVNVHPASSEDYRLCKGIFTDDGPLIVYQPKVANGRV